MALHMAFNTAVSPITLTVTADTATERTTTVSVQSNGETASGSILWPVVVTDSSSHVWTKVSDDGQTAVFHY